MTLAIDAEGRISGDQKERVDRRLTIPDTYGQTDEKVFFRNAQPT